jgi:penicillin V acylase-like amidase (Ntn superfamily)
MLKVPVGPGKERLSHVPKLPVEGGGLNGRDRSHYGDSQPDGAKITVLPRGFSGAGIAPSGTGKSWTSAYGVVWVDAFGQPGWLTDAMNEKGVYAGLLCMPGFCDYPAADDKDPSTCMSIVNAIAYVLGTCESVAQATTALSCVTVWPWTVEGFGFPALRT